MTITTAAAAATPAKTALTTLNRRRAARAAVIGAIAQVDQLALEPVERLADPALHGSLRLVEHHGHLPVGQPSEIGELDGLPLRLRQLGDRRTHIVCQQGLHDLVLDRRCCGRPACVVALAMSARLLGPQEIDGSAVGLSREKRPQASPIGIEPLGSVPEPHEDLLDDVLGEPSIIKETLRQAEQAGRVSALDLGERVLLPASHRHREAAVASRSHIDLHLGRYPTPLVSRMTHLRAHDT
jgi:hypothetical protein